MQTRFTIDIRNLIDAHHSVDATIELQEWINASLSNKESFVSYCLFNIDKAIKRQQWDSEFKACCEFIADANSKIVYTKEQNIRLAEKLKPHIEGLIPTFSNPAKFVAYAKDLHKQGQKFLLGFIVAYLKDNSKDKTNDVWSQYLSECISQCDTSVLSELGDIFTNEYKKSKYDVTALNAKQLNSLVKDDLLLFIIDKWKGIDENKYISDFIFISQNIGINEIVCGKVYDKLAAVLGDLRGVVAEDLLYRISIINKITENLLVGQNYEPMLKLYKLITGHRTIPNPSYPNHRQYDNQVRLLDECTEVEDINVISRFITTTYKVLQGRINVIADLEILMVKDAKTTLENILWLKRTWNYSLYPLASHLIKYTLYDNEELMNIYQMHFVEQHNDAPILKEDELSDKLDNMLQYAIQNKDSKMFNWLNNISSRNNRVKTILIPIISERPIGEIQSLPKDLMDLAINSVNEHNIESYRKFTDFLRCLAASGSTSQKQHLVRLIINMLDEKDEIEKVVSIIKSYNQLAETYCKRITSTLECIIEDNSDPDMVAICKDGIEHLSSLNKATSKTRKRKSA